MGGGFGGVGGSWQAKKEPKTHRIRRWPGLAPWTAGSSRTGPLELWHPQAWQSTTQPCSP
jgi:hypothetical protein